VAVASSYLRQASDRAVILSEWYGINLIPLPHQFNMVTSYESGVPRPRYHIFHEIYHQGSQ
jgi:hypothetical protein